MIPRSNKTRIITRSRYNAQISHGKKNGLSLQLFCARLGRLFLRQGEGEKISRGTDVEHHAETRLAAHHALVSLGGSFQGKNFVHRMDAVQRAEVQCVL